MPSSPTGRVVSTSDGRDLVLTRTFHAPVEDVWACVTESDQTARWFASWWGDPAPGRAIGYRLEFEDGAPAAEMTIVACEPPRHLAVTAEDQYGSWYLEVTLRGEDGATALTFVHHLDADADVSSVGPGWEYYLDRLVAVHDGGPVPDFDDYFPAQADYYRQQLSSSS